MDCDRRGYNVQQVSVYNEIVDMSIQQAIQYLERVNGGELRPDMLAKVIKRMEDLKGIDVSRWKRWAGK